MASPHDALSSPSDTPRVPPPHCLANPSSAKRARPRHSPSQAMPRACLQTSSTPMAGTNHAKSRCHCQHTRPTHFAFHRRPPEQRPMHLRLEQTAHNTQRQGQQRAPPQFTASAPHPADGAKRCPQRTAQRIPMWASTKCSTSGALSMQRARHTSHSRRNLVRSAALLPSTTPALVRTPLPADHARTAHLYASQTWRVRGKVRPVARPAPSLHRFGAMT
jgi:hypothetical protein